MRSRGIPSRPRWGGVLAALVMFALPGETRAGTPFPRTDDTRTHVFSREAWFHPTTRLGFVPEVEHAFGGADVGFGKGWVPGGVSSIGVAFDRVSGFDPSHVHAPEVKPVRAYPGEPMLASCKTVDPAEVFDRTFREPDFVRSRNLVF